ncbi:hypothetical protein DXG01_005715 [Tephrocybe rancida]|nr:hypothetical protein DXG01_005715 [Tephrocybe rancida]
MSLLQDVLRSKTADIDRKLKSVEISRRLATNASDESDDDIVNVVSLPGTPDRTRPSSPTRGASARPLRGPLHISSSRRDFLRAFPTEVSQRIFAYLSIPQLARCALVSKKWRRSQTINYVWFQHYRKENFQDDSLPPGKWTKRESKQDWRVTHLRSRGDRSPKSSASAPFSRGSGYSSPAIDSGYQTPRELKEEQWKLEAEATSRPGKVEMRGMYKELGGRKSKSKSKFGAPGSRDKGGWDEGGEWLHCYPPTPNQLSSLSISQMASGMRSLVSYDDITTPYQPNPPPRHQQNQSNKPPPSKKRKWNKNSKGRNNTGYGSLQSFSNNPGQASSSMYTAGDESIHMEAEEESRDLTQDEIWDDSALINAWNAATEEYEAFNGPDKGWKNEPVHNSPLWYNIPKLAEGKEEHGTSNGLGHVSVPPVPDSTEENSRPLDFDTFEPSHDPSLYMPDLGPKGVPKFLSDVPGPTVSQDESFTRALGAMYWSGYWTAMYHAQRRLGQDKKAEDEVQQGEEDSFDEGESCENGEEEEEEEDAFVSTQR